MVQTDSVSYQILPGRRSCRLVRQVCRIPLWPGHLPVAELWGGVHQELPVDLVANSGSWVEHPMDWVVRPADWVVRREDWVARREDWVACREGWGVLRGDWAASRVGSLVVDWGCLIEVDALHRTGRRKVLVANWLVPAGLAEVQQLGLIAVVVLLVVPAVWAAAVVARAILGARCAAR